MAQIEKMLALNPDDNFLQHALALEHVGAGNPQKAQAIFEELLQKDPTYVASYYQLAKLYEASGNAAAALDFYEKGMAVAKQSGDTKAFNELQSAYDELAY